MSDATFKCPHCGQLFAGSKDDVGAEAECPSCGNIFTLKVLAGASGKRPNALMCYFKMFWNYFDFKGRTRRREFWWAFFFWGVVYIAAMVVDFMVWDAPSWCAVTVLLVSAIPFFAAHARRLHDTNKSGWWIPLVLLCPINIAYFVWLATDGDKGPNRFGPDPKGREHQVEG